MMDNLEMLKSIDARLTIIVWCFLVLTFVWIVFIGIRIWYTMKPGKRQPHGEDDFDNLIHEKITQCMSDDLISEANQKLVKFPKHARAIYALGIGYYQKGMYEESLQKFKEVLEINPSYKDFVKEYLARLEKTPNDGVQPIAEKTGSG
jgi:tetratricopeptide (TPR) repeat protein